MPQVPLCKSHALSRRRREPLCQQVPRESGQEQRSGEIGMPVPTFRCPSRGGAARRWAARAWSWREGWPARRGAACHGPIGPRQPGRGRARPVLMRPCDSSTEGRAPPPAQPSGAREPWTGAGVAASNRKAFAALQGAIRDTFWAASDMGKGAGEPLCG